MRKMKTIMNEEWTQKLKYLRLRNLLEHWDEILATARKGRYSSERLLNPTYSRDRFFKA